jgi:hypothetical protein
MESNSFPVVDKLEKVNICVIASEAKQSHSIYLHEFTRLLRHSLPRNDKIAFYETIVVP